MGTSKNELAAQIQALGTNSLMGVQVNPEEVNKILRMCQTEEDKRVLRELCDAFGLSHSE